MNRLARNTMGLLGALLLAGPAVAGVGINVDVLWNPNPNDNSQVFLHLSNMAYPVPREQVVTVFHQLQDPCDAYPVLAFIAYHGHVDINTVWQYRRKGHEWFATMRHFGVPPSVLFVDLPRPPGPPYGKAYGHWKKQRDKIDPKHVSNDDVRYWVSLHMLNRYSGDSPLKVVMLKEGGQDFPQIAGGKYRYKNKGKQAEPQEAGFGYGKGNGKAKGHNKNHE